ncbi:MAG: FeoA family protein [Desulfobulbus sp.]|jgi:ferrous iron transport protein A
MPRHQHRHGQHRRETRCLCRLNDLKPGERARIHCHHTKGAIRQRLLDLGLVPRAEIDLIRRAPLGDPIECQVSNYKIVLRATEAALVEVEY